jgi:hypothetical protein
MTFTREQQKEAYQKLSSKVQNFIMDNETTELIGNLLSESGLSEEQSNDADSEILYTMYGLQTLSGAINNIANISNKNVVDFSKLKENLENSIFNKITEINANNNEPQAESVESQTSNNVGSDFEQIILNQAKAMQPAREAPSNLPTDGGEIEEKPKAIHNYVPGADPYREPVE